MSELELALQQEGLLDLALQRCRETGLSLTEILRSLLMSDGKIVGVRPSKQVSEEEHLRVYERILAEDAQLMATDPKAALARFRRSCAEFPVEFTSEEAREIARG